MKPFLRIKHTQDIIGGKVVYLECEDKQKLFRFYEKKGFTQFNKREIESDEDGLDGKYLIQLLKYG